MKIAVKTLGLDELSPFILEERVIEYMLDDNNTKRLIDMNLSEFTNETSSESPALAVALFLLIVGLWVLL